VDCLRCLRCSRLSSASMRQIAKEAGTTIQRFVYHVSSKEDLWKLVLKRVVSRWELHRKAMIESVGDAPSRGQAPASHHRHGHFFGGYARRHRIMTFEGRSTERAVDLVVRQFPVAQVREAVEMIEEAQRDGTVRRVDPARLRYAILSICAVPFTIAAEFQATTVMILRPRRNRENDRFYLRPRLRESSNR